MLFHSLPILKAEIVIFISWRTHGDPKGPDIPLRLLYFALLVLCWALVECFLFLFISSKSRMVMLHNKDTWLSQGILLSFHYMGLFQQIFKPQRSDFFIRFSAKTLIISSCFHCCISRKMLEYVRSKREYSHRKIQLFTIQSNYLS